MRTSTIAILIGAIILTVVLSDTLFQAAWTLGAVYTLYRITRGIIQPGWLKEQSFGVEHEED